MTRGQDSKLEKLPSLLSSGRYCKSGLQSGEAPVQDSMVGDSKHSRRYGLTPPITRGGVVTLPHCADRKITGGRYCKPVLQSGEAPVRDSMVGDFKHPRKYRITSPINMEGGSFPLPHCADRITTGWWMLDQELDKLIDMLSKMKDGQVDDGFLPNTEKISLGGLWSWLLVRF